MEKRLMDALDFTPADLQANRAGEVSAAQQEKLAEIRSSENQDITFAALFLVIPLLFGCGICLFLFNVPTIIASVDYLVEVIIVFIIAVLVAVGWSAWQGRAAGQATRQGVVAMVEGPLSLATDEQRSRSRFFVVIGEERFHIPWRIYDALNKYRHTGAVHRLYYIPGVRYVLSMEPVA